MEEEEEKMVEAEERARVGEMARKAAKEETLLIDFLSMRLVYGSILKLILIGGDGSFSQGRDGQGQTGG